MQIRGSMNNGLGVGGEEKKGDVNRWLFSDYSFQLLTTKAPNYFLSFISSIAHLMLAIGDIIRKSN